MPNTAIGTTTMSAMAWIASRQEKGAGLTLIAAALLLHPLVLIGMLIAGISIYELRHIVVVPISVFGMTLFAISLTRARVKLEHELAARIEAQAALQHLNESLEHRVAQRTEELHDMVAGLESFNRSVSHDLRPARRRGDADKACDRRDRPRRHRTRGADARRGR